MGSLLPARWYAWFDHQEPATDEDRDLLPFHFDLDENDAYKFLRRKNPERADIEQWCMDQGSWFMHTVERQDPSIRVHRLHFEDENRALAFRLKWIGTPAYQP